MRSRGGVQVQLGQPSKSSHAERSRKKRKKNASRRRRASQTSGAKNMGSAGKTWLLLAGFVLLYVVYLLFGALVFSSIERPVEERLRRELELVREEFLNHSCVSAAALERLLARVIRASKSGVSVLRNASDGSNWDLASSMFFANTLVTTVGESLNRGEPGRVFTQKPDGAQTNWHGVPGS
ncbi:unnamed protein product [Menidia menidia]|uniref:(Atlantic silverside) hypothetical protein n=1 Tax=Menidia menidia TaxID=238744 RepID=A0A8S4BJ43_9TELE|nr:unnamed protein product [Menidia menidia]